jgi:hypothetical protein
MSFIKFHIRMSSGNHHGLLALLNLGSTAYNFFGLSLCGPTICMSNDRCFATVFLAMLRVSNFFDGYFSLLLVFGCMHP